MIKYQKGFKYQLIENYILKTFIIGINYVSKFILLSKDGTLKILPGYAWDGSSGPTWDDKSNMEAALIHDALYQLMRQEVIKQEWKVYADKEYIRICKEKKMNKFRQLYYAFGLKYFASFARKPRNKKKVYTIN